jgi:hypothetical protein
MQQRRSVASDYIRANFLPDDRLAIVLIHKRSGAVTTRVSTADRIASDEYQAWLRHMNAQRHEIYLSMNTLGPEARGRLKSDIAEVRHVYLDFDQNGTEAVAAMRARDDMPVPNHILTSSPGKFQVIWRVAEFRKDEAEDLMRRMTRELGADIAATDCTRVLRVPGFNNHKYDAPHFVTVQNLSAETHKPSSFPEFPSDGQTRQLGSLSGTMGTNRRQSGGGESQSERDWAFALRSLMRGEEPADVARAIEAYRSDKPNPKYYAEYTVEKAQVALGQQHQGRVDGVSDLRR